MKDRSSVRISRREFLGGVLVGGAGLVLGCRVSPEEKLERAARLPGPKSRRVWAMADPHVGLAGRHNDGRDGADWLQVCVQDVRRRIGSVDYVLGLGDLTHHAGHEDELRAYVRVRNRSGLPVWYEMAGNHDYAAIPAGLWRRYIRQPPRYAVIDGTLAWFFISAERGKSDGLVGEATADWLKDAVARHQDKRNIIVCSHQAVHATVNYSGDEAASLNPRERVADILSSVRVDLWLCGHIHGGKREPGYVRRLGRTTYINVAAAGRAYATRACNGYILDMAEGSNTMLARCRDHDHDRYVRNQEARVTFPYPARFFARPVLLPARIPILV